MANDLKGQGSAGSPTYAGPSDQSKAPKEGPDSAPKNVAGKEAMNFEPLHGFGGSNPGPH